METSNIADKVVVINRVELGDRPSCPITACACTAGFPSYLNGELAVEINFGSRRFPSRNCNFTSH
jgi:hypothetical protein